MKMPAMKLTEHGLPVALDPDEKNTHKSVSSALRAAGVKIRKLVALCIPIGIGCFGLLLFALLLFSVSEHATWINIGLLCIYLLFLLLAFLLSLTLWQVRKAEERKA